MALKACRINGRGSARSSGVSMRRTLAGRFCLADALEDAAATAAPACRPFAQGARSRPGTRRSRCGAAVQILQGRGARFGSTAIMRRASTLNSQSGKRSTFGISAGRSGPIATGLIPAARITASASSICAARISRQRRSASCSASGRPDSALIALSRLINELAPQHGGHVGGGRRPEALDVQAGRPGRARRASTCISPLVGAPNSDRSPGVHPARR